MISKKLPTLIYAYLALLAATAIWGVALPVMKLTLADIPVYAFLFFRFLLVCIIVLPYLIFELKNNPIDKRDLTNLTILGLLGQSSLILIFLGINFTTAIDTAIISVIAPIITIAAGYYFYKEKINKGLEVGIIFATVGTLFIVVEPILMDLSGDISHTTAGTRIIGNLLVILYNISFAAYIILSKRVMGDETKELRKTFRILDLNPLKKAYPPFVHVAFSFYIALLTVIPFFVLESFGVFGPNRFNYSMLSARPLIGIVYMALISSLAAYFLFEWGLKRARVSDTALFGYLGPLFTIPSAFLLISEIPSILSLIGTAIIVIGVIIAEKNKS